MVNNATKGFFFFFFFYFILSCFLDINLLTPMHREDVGKAGQSPLQKQAVVPKRWAERQERIYTSVTKWPCV